MAWTLLIIAGLLKVGWAVGLKYTWGFTRLIPTVFTAISMIASVGILGFSLKTLPIGTADAVWTGIGTVGTVIAGSLLLGETVSIVRICLIVAGIVGLKMLPLRVRSP